VRGIVDGHIVLTRQLAMKNHYPAINVGASVSRLMSSIVSKEHKELASRIRDILSVYNDNADLIAIGAYKAGTNPRLDYAISKIDSINDFLKQQVDKAYSYEETIEIMRSIINS
jgi:flagellum-specific ATP synthase